MTTSPPGRKLIESFESLRLVAYWDLTYLDAAKTQKRWSIGYGHTTGVHEGDTCDDTQADAWLSEDLATAEEAVNRLVAVPLNQNRFDALVSFTFNAGVGENTPAHKSGLAGSTLLKLINAGAMGAAALEFTKWDLAGGHPSAGLLRRRQAEQVLFVAPV